MKICSDITRTNIREKSAQIYAIATSYPIRFMQEAMR